MVLGVGSLIVVLGVGSLIVVLGVGVINSGVGCRGH